MGFWGRLGLSILGWSVGGPIGALIGYLIGNQMDKQQPHDPRNQQDIFFLSLIGLLAAITKADKRIDAREKETVKSFITTQFPNKANDLIQIYEQALLENYNLDALINAINPYLDHTAKVALLDVLFKVAYADDELHTAEFELIKKCAQTFGVSDYELESLRIQNQPRREKTQATSGNINLTKEEAYKILGVSPDASAEQIKQAYREKIKKYHPDRFANLGEEFVKIAEEKTKLFNEAYRILSS